MRPLWYGIDEDRPPHGERAVGIGPDAAWTVAADGTTETHRIEVRFPGDHNRRNLAGAFAAALLCCESVAGGADAASAYDGAAGVEHGAGGGVACPRAM